MPDAHTLFMVVAQTFSGKPAAIEACLAGACPKFAESTLPITIVSILSLSIWAFLTACSIATAPKSVAETLDKAPPKAPIGVLTAEMI